MAFTLTSPDFNPGSKIPERLTCAGKDMSPELQWSDPPEGTASYALVMEDPDAPGGTWVHWVLWDIPGGRHTLAGGLPKHGQLDDGIRQGRAYGVDHFRKVGYFGPCPPLGPAHRYYFRLYALDKRMDLPEGSEISHLRKKMEGHELGRAELMGTFSKEHA